MTRTQSLLPRDARNHGVAEPSSEQAGNKSKVVAAFPWKNQRLSTDVISEGEVLDLIKGVPARVPQQIRGLLELDLISQRCFPALALLGIAWSISSPASACNCSPPRPPGSAWGGSGRSSVEPGLSDLSHGEGSSHQQQWPRDFHLRGNSGCVERLGPDSPEAGRRRQERERKEAREV